MGTISALLHGYYNPVRVRMMLARLSRYISNVVIGGRVRKLMRPYDTNYTTSMLHLLLKSCMILLGRVIIRSIFNKRSARGWFYNLSIILNQ